MAKPRTRSFLPPLRGAFLDHDTPRCHFPIQPTPIKSRFQARCRGTTWQEPTDNSLVPTSFQQWSPRPVLLTPWSPLAAWGSVGQVTELSREASAIADLAWPQVPRSIG